MNKPLINSTIHVSICVCNNKVCACICENNNKQKLTIRILNTVFVMKRKKGYETPLIEKFRVELEEGVCNTASVMTEGTQLINLDDFERLLIQVQIQDL